MAILVSMTLECDVSQAYGPMKSSEIRKVYVNQDNKVTLVCTHCGTARTVSVTRSKDCGHPLNLKCTCQSTFRVLIERRKTYRKEVQLDGHYVKLPPTTERGAIAVKNISLGGIGFTVPASAKHNLSTGDHVRLTFQLDDRRQSEIVQSAVVKSLQERHVGCEFTNVSDENRKLLGFYLMP